MPRATNIQITSAFDQVQKHARQLLVKLRSEIDSKEGDLRRLKEEESKLAALTAQQGISNSNGARRTASGSTSRIDWGTVLEKLPKQFKASDIRTVRAVKDKRPSELFAAITRWMEAGTVKRKDRGLYERV
jgi:SMC interacting uncharacterized protein involved in chromosome segregation